MDYGFLLFKFLIGLLIGLIFFMVFKILFKSPGRYQFNLIFMTPGVNPHETVYNDELEFSHEFRNRTYEIKADRLYRLRPGKARKYFNRLRNVREVFTVAYLYKKTKPLGPISVNVSNRILKEVNESRALDRGMRGEFKLPMDMKKLLMVVGVIVVVIVAYILVSGDLVL